MESQLEPVRTFAEPSPTDADGSPGSPNTLSSATVGFFNTAMLLRNAPIAFLVQSMAPMLTIVRLCDSYYTKWLELNLLAYSQS